MTWMASGRSSRMTLASPRKGSKVAGRCRHETCAVCSFSQSRVGLPGAARNRINPLRTNLAMLVPDVVNDAGDYARSRKATVDPNMFIYTKRINAPEPVRAAGAPLRLGLHGLPERNVTSARAGGPGPRQGGSWRRTTRRLVANHDDTTLPSDRRKLAGFDGEDWLPASVVNRGRGCPQQRSRNQPARTRSDRTSCSR